MLNQEATLRLAADFKSHWLYDCAEQELTAIMDTVTRRGEDLPLVFIGPILPESWEEARVKAAKALNAAVWTTDYAQRSGYVVFPSGIKTFSTEPAYLIAPLGAFAYAAYMNAACIMNSTEEEYTELREKASAEHAKWTRSIGNPLSLFNMRLNQTDKLSYKLESMKLTDAEKNAFNLVKQLRAAQ